jgi:Flp pilus assembly protein TadD
MQTRSRVLALVAASVVACVAIAAGIWSQQSDVGGDLGGAPRELDTAAVVSQPADLGENDSPFASGSSAGMPHPGVGAGAAPAAVSDLEASTDPIALTKQARALLAAGENETAAAHAERAVDLAPTSGSAWNVLGRAKLALGQTVDAESAFATACDVDPNNAWAHNNLGWLHLQRGEWVEAASWLETAIDLKDDVAAFHNNLGLAYERLGRAADAQRAYERAVLLQPEHAMARVSLARVQARLQPGLAVAEAPPADTVSSRVATGAKPE